MSITDRDKKIMLALVPILVLVAYWFLVLGPKRDEASKATADLTTQQQRLDDARAEVKAAVKHAATTRLDADLKAGRITKAQHDEEIGEIGRASCRERVYSNV